MAEWLNQFVIDHFPAGLGAIEQQMRELLLEAYIDGMRYGQEVAELESKIVVPGKMH